MDTALTAADTTPVATPASMERKRFLMDVFTTALEGGIGYWSQTTAYHWKLKGVEGTVDECSDLDGFYATIEETEHEASEGGEPPTHRIDASVIEKGLATIWSTPSTGLHLHAKNKAIVMMAMVHAEAGDWDEIDFDADVADWIVQVGLFGQVVYG